MFWLDFIAVVIIALVLSSILVWGFSWRHPARRDTVGPSLLFLFLILLFAVWAGGAWFPPWGPLFLDTAWMAFLLIGLFVSLIVLAAAAPMRPPRTPSAARAEAEETAVVGTVFGVFFWVLILGFLIAVIVGYAA